MSNLTDYVKILESRVADLERRSAADVAELRNALQQVQKQLEGGESEVVQPRPSVKGAVLSHQERQGLPAPNRAGCIGVNPEIYQRRR